MAAAAFAPDGTRIVTRDKKGGRKVWDAECGREIAGAADEIGEAGSAFSPDAKWFLYGGELGNVRLVPTTMTPDELTRRRELTRPRPERHKAATRPAAKTKNDRYAIAFHVDRLTLLDPWDVALRRDAVAAWAWAEQPDKAAAHVARLILMPALVPGSAPDVAAAFAPPPTK